LIASFITFAGNVIFAYLALFAYQGKRNRQGVEEHREVSAYVLNSLAITKQAPSISNQITAHR
jgi:hypothetical protein